MTCDKKVIERPQHMIMRVALGELDDIKDLTPAIIHTLNASVSMPYHTIQYPGTSKRTSHNPNLK